MTFPYSQMLGLNIKYKKPLSTGRVHSLLKSSHQEEQNASKIIY